MPRKPRPVGIDPAFEYQPQTGQMTRCGDCRRLYTPDPAGGQVFCPYCTSEIDLFEAMEVPYQ